MLSVISAQILSAAEFPVPKIEFNPHYYICHKTPEAPTIDGKISEKSWENVKWSESFVDIEGDLKPLPEFDTKVKMMWDDNYFYFAALMEEPHVWGKLTERDAVIFHDNDFEIFIDPDGDTHDYYEFEVNALNTVWDLLIAMPYRDMQKVAIDSWNIVGLKSAVYVSGSVNNPEDTDNFWSVEAAIPWQVLEERADNYPPKEGTQWRVNFSRVEWDTEIKNGEYHKLKKPEHNWVWSPQGLIAMHYPEMWGFVQFSETSPEQSGKIKYIHHPVEDVKWELRKFYYFQKNYCEKKGEYCRRTEELPLKINEIKGFEDKIMFTATRAGYEAVIQAEDKKSFVAINQNGLCKVYDE
ncbi:MAG: carbohydrate-binding family 9-like protein [Candidatus Cloacimonadota bacterium]|nr:MAG: carbohydrate-binding family 9-like protein [Candidatus Cloacimonadota bacterium]